MVEEPWVEIGKYYMAKARLQDEWTAFLLGLLHTNLRRVDRDRESLDFVLGFGETPDELFSRCPISPEELDGLNVYHRGYFAKSLCEKSNRDIWNVIEDSLKKCDRRRLQFLKNERWDLFGLGWKGIDMLLLDSGCDTIVVDRHMVRFLAELEPEKVWEIIPHPPDISEKSKFMKRFNSIRCSSNPGLYNRLWEIGKEIAEKEGLSPGVWHVAVWMKKRFSVKPFDRLTEEQRIETAWRYVRKLFKK